VLSSIDRAVVTFLNQFVGRAPALDALLVAVSVNDLVKGNAVMAVLWMLWFSPWPACQGPARRAGLIAGLAGSIAALALTRLLSLVLPFSARPLHEPALHLVTPAGLAPTSYSDLSSFPSDHAALFVGLAVTISFASRRWGLIVLAYVLAVICLPRLYLGLHYPSDLLAGAGEGAGEQRSRPGGCWTSRAGSPAPSPPGPTDGCRPSTRSSSSSPSRWPRSSTTPARSAAS
jgi:undecaprenyl-diphosphatase